ncbi:glycine receptor subunit alpha-4 isoform X1 [Drosophila persimilis]|uniref:glycine receptor subunit alpha-4 isoform X1 n=1 Tax=Drosophila persimilis TaxID=7234 RepID=UPI000F0956A4|nr:glycine receptor subunit alpha-4 isoform X1 [Drosophila persimilis]
MQKIINQLGKYKCLIAVAIILHIVEKSILLCNCVHGFRNNTESAELVSHYESSLSLPDILPIPSKTYDKNRAPKLLGQPTVVYFHVTVLSLDSINEESMTYVTDIFLAQSWRDPRLRLPENMSEQYRILDVDWLHSIWRPDCFFKNAKKVTFHEMSIPNHYLWLYHDKTLLYMSKLTLVLSCAMKFESYPHDTQICSMMIESLSHTVEDLVFIWNMTDPLVVNAEIELPQLDISNNYTTDCTIEYSTGNFTCLAIVFNLRRRLGYHLFHTYIPSALIVVMSWISFWIKPEAIPARVTLGVTSLLTLATQNTQSQQSLPPVSYVKAIDVWMSSCSVFVFLSLMEFAVVNNFMGPVATKAMKGYSDENITDMDDLKVSCCYTTIDIQWLLANALQHHHRESIIEPQYDTFCHGHATAIYIDKFSRFFFPFSFFILNIVYWTTFL